MEINIEYKDKYLKYKQKYLNLQKQIQQNGGMEAAAAAPNDICLVVGTDHPEELDDIMSLPIYEKLLNDGNITELKLLVNSKISSLPAFEKAFGKGFADNGVLEVDGKFKIYDYERAVKDFLISSCATCILAIQGPITKPKYESKKLGYVDLLGKEPDHLFIQGIDFNVKNSHPTITAEVQSFIDSGKLFVNTTGGPTGTTGVHFDILDEQTHAAFTKLYNGEIYAAAINFWGPKVCSTSLPIQNIPAPLPFLRSWWQTSVSYPPAKPDGSNDINQPQANHTTNTNITATESMLEVLCAESIEVHGPEIMGPLKLTSTCNNNARTVQEFRRFAIEKGISEELYESMIKFGNVMVSNYVEKFKEPTYEVNGLDWTISCYKAASLIVSRVAINKIYIGLTSGMPTAPPVEVFIQPTLVEMPAILEHFTANPKDLPYLDPARNMVVDKQKIVEHNIDALQEIIKVGTDLSGFNHVGDAGLALIISDALYLLQEGKSLNTAMATMKQKVESDYYRTPEAGKRMMDILAEKNKPAAGGFRPKLTHY